MCRAGTRKRDNSTVILSVDAIGEDRLAVAFAAEVAVEMDAARMRTFVPKRYALIGGTGSHPFLD